jgi:hypothetical protein
MRVYHLVDIQIVLDPPDAEYVYLARVVEN